MPYLSSRLCEHPNEVPHVCPCVPDCFCRSTSCPVRESAASPVPQPLSAVDRLLTQEVIAEDNLFIVRLWDMFDGWVDVSEPIPEGTARTLWLEKTKDGTQRTKFEDGDYYRVFPADTRMLITPDFTGR